MIEVANTVVIAVCLCWFGSYIVIIDYKANKKLKEGR
jgi:hypothetical protein